MKEGDKAVARMRQVYDKRRKPMVELMREVGFGIPVMPQGAFYVFADASKWTDDSYKFDFELLEKAGVGVPTEGGSRVGGQAWTSVKRGRGPGGEATRRARRTFGKPPGGCGSACVGKR